MYPGCECDDGVDADLVLVLVVTELEVECPTGHFLSGRSNAFYPATRSLDLTGTGQTQWDTRRNPATNTPAIALGDRWSAAETC